MTYNVFIDHGVTGQNIETFSVESAYDASALANAFDGAGYSVCTDLWNDTVWDAMISPAVWEQFDLDRYPPLRFGCTGN